MTWQEFSFQRSLRAIWLACACSCNVKIVPVRNNHKRNPYSLYFSGKGGSQEIIKCSTISNKFLFFNENIIHDFFLRLSNNRKHLVSVIRKKITTTLSHRHKHFLAQATAILERRPRLKKYRSISAQIIHNTQLTKWHAEENVTYDNNVIKIYYNILMTWFFIFYFTPAKVETPLLQRTERIMAAQMAVNSGAYFIQINPYSFEMYLFSSSAVD